MRGCLSGSFARAGGSTRNRLAALSTSTDAATSWNPGANDTVTSIALAGGRMYAAGKFSIAGGLAREGFAAFDAVTGDASAEVPRAGGDAHSVSVVGQRVYFAGPFTSVAGSPRGHLAALDWTTGAWSAWAPDVSDGAVIGVVPSGDELVLYGGFSMVNGHVRENVAAFEPDGKLSPFAPKLDGVVKALAVSGSVLYVGGNFNRVDNNVRNRLAAIDTATASATEWDPNVSAQVEDLAVDGAAGIVYLGGRFEKVNGSVVRNGLAAVSTSGTGAATPWNPNVNGGSVLSLVLDLAQTRLFVGGTFKTVGGVTHKRLAAVSLVNGAVSAWEPRVETGSVYGIAYDSAGSRLYIGGTFATVAGQRRSRLAAIRTDADTGNLEA